MLSKDIYSPFKAAYHLERIQSLRAGDLILPTHIQIDLTNRCNHDCPYCFYRGVNKIVTEFDRKAVLPFEAVKKLIKDFEVPSLQLTGGGEPLMYPHFLDVLDLINNTNIEPALVSNGALLTDAIIDRLYKFAWIRISVDAATKETYAKSQGSVDADYNKVLTNISKLVQRLPNTVVGVSFVCSPINYTEIYSACKFFKVLGVKNVRLSIAYTDHQNMIFEKFSKDMMEQAKEAQTLSDDTFRVFNLVHTHTAHLGVKKNYKVCGYSHFTAAIEANGVVRPCCTLKGLPHSNFGNIIQDSFKDIWFGDVRRKWLKNFDANKCILCWMDDKNEFIEYLINSQEPPHVNFI